MVSFEEAQDILTELADSLPPEIFRELNGGIILLPDAMYHPESRADDFYILGQYHVEPVGMGRYITLHYGSFAATLGGRGDKAFRKKLEEVLHHELVHHLESLAGDRSLEIQDAKDLERYRRRHPPGRE